MEQHITYQGVRAQKKVTPLLTAGRFVNNLLLTACCLLTFGTSSHAQTWMPVATNAPHYNAGVMILLTDGTVICKTSSGPGNGNKWDKLTPDATGSYANGTWSTIATMTDDRLYFSSQVLQDGRVYVAGGEYGAGGDNSEVYDPLTDTWTPCPSIITGLPGISDANSELLPNGKVLQAVVSAGTKKNYIWDPATNLYTPTGNCLRTDNEAPWVKLPDNSIIFVDNYSTTSERYIPSTGTWVNDGTVPVSLYDAFGSEAGGGFLLPDGRVYFIGSRPTSAYYTPSGTASPGTWAAGPAIPGLQGAPDAAAAMMVDGGILMAVSPEPYAANHFPDSTVFKVFNYLTNTYTPVAPPVGGVGDTVVMPCYYTNMLCLPDGKILFSRQGDDSYYEFTPAGAPLAAGKPTISNIIENTCTQFTITGTLFNGISEGACYGDDWQMETNYPIVRLKSGPNVYYARTTNWNSTGVMRGSAPDTAQFTLPAGLPNGPYLVEVVTNGNPSATYPLTVGPANLSPTSASTCAGVNTSLSASISGGAWTSSNSAIAAVGSTSGTVTGNTAGTATMTYGLGTCISTTTVTVLPIPAAISPASVAICMGNGSSMTDATPSGFWSSSDNFVATVTSGGIINSTGTGTATISYTQGGCVTTAAVTVNNLPGSITGVKGVCVGFTTALTNSIGGGTWTSINTAIATVGTSSGVVSGGAVGTSQIIYTLPTGCITTTTVNVGSTTSPITGSGSMCLGSTATLSNAAPGGSWSSSNTSVATVGSGSGAVSGLAIGTSTITYALGAGCYSTTVVTVSTTFSVLPSVTLAVSPGTTLCNSTIPVTFVPTAINGGSAPAYKWYVNGTLMATTNSYVYTPATSDVVQCILKSNAACAFPDTATTSVTMTINPLHTPTIGITAAPGTTLCEGKLATFTVVPAFGGTAPKYLWTKNSVAVGTGLTYAYTPANGDVISCMLTSDYNCVTSSTANSNNITMSVTTPAVNSITIKVTKLSIGAGQRDTFTAVAPHAGVAPVYQWYLNGTALPGETKVTYVTNKLANGDIIKCSVVTSEDCAAPDKAISGGIAIKVGGSGVSVKEIGNTTGGFTLTPNPNNGVFTISGTLKNIADTRVNITVTNVLGQAIYKETFSAENGALDQRIALQNNIANGTYLVSVASGDQHVVFHVVVNR